MRYLWYMRGGITLSEVYQLPPVDRQIVDEVIKDNIENTKKTKMPLL